MPFELHEGSVVRFVFLATWQFTEFAEGASPELTFLFTEYLTKWLSLPVRLSIREMDRWPDPANDTYSSAI
jgi:hypothetical protein